MTREQLAGPVGHQADWRNAAPRLFKISDPSLFQFRIWSLCCRIRRIDGLLTKLDLAWTAWQALSRTDRARFLACLRDAYAREREAAAWQKGSARGIRVSRFTTAARPIIRHIRWLILVWQMEKRYGRATLRWLSDSQATQAGLFLRSAVARFTRLRWHSLQTVMVASLRPGRTCT